MVKRCPRCGQDKPLSDFYLDRSKASGLRSRCKVCDNAKARAYYEANRARVIMRVKVRQAKKAAAQS